MPLLRARPAQPSTDDALVAARLAAGDDSALAEAFDALGGAVHAAARQIVGEGTTAQDVLQDVFVTLWLHPHRYDPGRGPLRTYLCMLARRRSLDLLRAETRRQARERVAHSLVPRARTSPDESDQRLVSGLIHDAVRRLPTEQRQVIELAYFEGLSYREVALTLGVPEGTAKSRVRLALTKLETTLDRALLEPS